MKQSIALPSPARVLPRGELRLVNRSHPLPAELAPPALAPALPGHPDILLEARAAAALTALVSALGRPGEIVPVSGFRPHWEQQQIWDDSLRDKGPDFTAKYVAWPGCSEHETGLAIDLGFNRPPIDFIRPAFPRKGICQRFREQAAAYGFIERYRAGKEQVTGIGAEPWHFRFVGAPHAALMEARGLALEEYIQLLEDCAAKGEHLYHEDARGRWELWPVPEMPSVFTALPRGTALFYTGAGFLVAALRRAGR